MNISKLYLDASSGRLTCSMVTTLLMEQPTTDEESHAQLHLTDGFRHDPLKIEANWRTPGFVARKQAAWGQYDAHLFPEATSPIPVFRGGVRPTDRVTIDADRLPTSNKYNERTGLPEIPAIPQHSISYSGYFVLPKAGGKEEILRAPKSDANDLIARARANLLNLNDYRTETNGGPVRILHSTSFKEVVPKVPMVPASPAHTMFEDSESMVMHLTAALLSDAGIRMLEVLRARGHNDGKTVGLFSKTAIRIVAGATRSQRAAGNAAATDHGMIERTADADGDRNLLGTFSKVTKAINHVLLVMAVSPRNEALVLTCFPDPRPTAETIQRASGRYQDIVELVFCSANDDDYLFIEQNPRKAMPSLRW